MNPTRVALVIVVCLMTLGCAAPSTLISENDKNQINRVKIISVIPQEELRKQIYATSDPTGASLQGGAVGAAIGAVLAITTDHYRENSAEKSVARLREVLQGYNVNGKIFDEFSIRLPRLSWTQDVQVVRSDAMPSKNDLQLMLGSDQLDAIIVLESEYAVSPGFEIVEFETRITLYKNDSARKNESGGTHVRTDPVYSNVVTYQSDFHAPGTRRLTPAEMQTEQSRITQKYDALIAAATMPSKRQKFKSRKEFELFDLKNQKVNIETANVDGKMWLGDGGAPLKIIVDEGISEIGDMVFFELDQNQNEAPAEQIEARIMHLHAESGIDATAQTIVLRRSEDKHRIRLRLTAEPFDGYVYSIRDGDPIWFKDARQ